MRYLLFGLIALFPLPSQATFVQVDYEGIIGSVEGTGFGYAAGDPIVGQFIIDTDAIERTEACASYPGSGDVCTYFGSRLVMGGQEPVNTGFVFVSDRLHPTCFQCEFEDETIAISNGWREEIGDETLLRNTGFRVFDAELDFIHGNSLVQNFDLRLDGLSYYGNMYGNAWEERYKSETGQRIYSNYISYSLKSVRIASQELPEPGTLALLVAGFVGAAWSMRRKLNGSAAASGRALRPPLSTAA